MVHLDVGILRPNWLEGANYLGQEYVDGFLCNVWEKVDFIWYYEDVATKRPVNWVFYTGGVPISCECVNGLWGDLPLGHGFIVFFFSSFSFGKFGFCSDFVFCGKWELRISFSTVFSLYCFEHPQKKSLQ